MKKNILILAVALALPIIFHSCSNNDAEEPIYYGIATVVNPDSIVNFSFVHDNGNSLKVTESGLSDKNYKPADGKRIIPYYSYLSNNEESSTKNVRLLDIYEVLTKGIFEFTSETTQEVRDSIGDHPIKMLDIWVGSHYLNTEFMYLVNGSTIIGHYINLVSDKTKTYDDGKIHLEFRHNDNKDYPAYRSQGIASFDLRPLQSQGTDSVKLVIHVNEYEVEKEKTYELTYKFNNSSDAVKKTTSGLMYRDAFSEIK